MTLKKTRNKPDKTEPLKIKAAIYGLHLGELISNWFRINKHVTKVYIAEQLGISKVGFNNRLNLPYYGNAVELLEISLLLKEDFITPLLNVYKNRGHKVEKIYLEQDVADMQDKLKFTEDLLNRCQRESDLLHKSLNSNDKK